MSERETTETILPESKARVELYTYITHGQYKLLQKVLLKGMKIDPNAGENQKVQNISADTWFDQKDMAAEFLVKSIHQEDESLVDNIKQFIFDLSIVDGEFLDNKVEEIDNQSNLAAESKKK